MNSVGEKIARLHAAAKKRAAEKQKFLPVIYPEEESVSDKSTATRQTGKSAKAIRYKTTEDLTLYANDVGIEHRKLWPGKEYPTLFTRLPIFRPMQRSRARKQQAEATKSSDFVRLNSKWDRGGVWRAGPSLTILDEDTLVGLMQLRSMEFNGYEQLMPSKGSQRAELLASSGRRVIVHSVIILISELESLIRGKKPPKKGWGGNVIKQRRASIERLAATSLRFEQPKGLDLYRGKMIPIIEVAWIGDPKNACYYIQFHPAIVHWLNEYYTYIDLDIRRQLTPFGKALHRFLASQVSNSHFEIVFEVLLQAIGFDGRVGEAKISANAQMKVLLELGFAKSFAFKGNGRSVPFKLVVQFK